MHFKNKTFEQFKNVLSKEQHQHVLDVLTERAWSFDNWAEHEADKGILCWSMWGLETREFFNTMFFNRIQEITGRKYTYSRIYANGQSFGQDGVFHHHHGVVVGLCAGGQHRCAVAGRSGIEAALLRLGHGH